MNAYTKYINNKTELYRTDTINKLASTNKPREMFFTYGSNGAAKSMTEYSGAESSKLYTYKPMRRLKLINLKNVNGRQHLIQETTNNNLKKSIEQSFPLAENKMENGQIRHIVIRNSQGNSNRNVVQAVCNAGYDGYIANAFDLNNKIGSNKFHQEIAICAPHGKIKYNSYKPSGVAPSAPPKRKPSSRPLITTPVKGALFN